MIAAWALTEVPRYSYFAASALRGSAPYCLVWLRYSTFYLLYPLGAFGEAWTLWNALPEIERTKVYSIEMPNAWNFTFNFYVCCVFILGLYPIGLPYMYKHMIRQRKKNLSRFKKKRVESTRGNGVNADQEQVKKSQ